MARKQLHNSSVYKEFEKSYTDLTPDEKKQYFKNRQKDYIQKNRKKWNAIQKNRKNRAAGKPAPINTRALENTKAFQMFGKAYKDLTKNEKYLCSKNTQKVHIQKNIEMNPIPPQKINGFLSNKPYNEQSIAERKISNRWTLAGQARRKKIAKCKDIFNVIEDRTLDIRNVKILNDDKFTKNINEFAQNHNVNILVSYEINGNYVNIKIEENYHQIKDFADRIMATEQIVKNHPGFRLNKIEKSEQQKTRIQTIKNKILIVVKNIFKKDEPKLYKKVNYILNKK